MQKPKNLDTLIPKIKPLLRKYLEDNNTTWKSTLFTCPNRKVHNNGDSTPSCGFVPDTDEQVFHCFSCGSTGDVFTAYNYLTGKPITGSNFPEAVKNIAIDYKIEHELVELTIKEKELIVVNNYFSQIIDAGNKYLKSGKCSGVTEYIKNRNWDNCIDAFQLGYLPDDDDIKKVIDSAFIKYPFLENYIKLTAWMIVDRLIYPIKDSIGNVIGIGDRKVNENDKRPKYQKHLLKTLETGEVVFNISSIYPEVYLVEGGSSVFTLHKSGIKNAVACLGKEFGENAYKNLVKNGIKRVVLCFDGDDAGLDGLKKTISFFERHPDIKAAVKLLTGNLDPDDYVIRNGVDAFKKIPEVNIFHYQLQNFKETKDELLQDEYKKSLLEQICNASDKISANKMLDEMSKDLNISKKTLIEEVQKHSIHRTVNDQVSVGELIVEEEHLINNINKFEERSLRAGKLLGISTGFPLLDLHTDGLQEGLVLVSGRWNTGKSAFAQSLIINMLKDPSNFVLYFSIDDSVIGKTIPRLLANMASIPINTIINPIHKITQNEELNIKQREYMLKKRDIAIEDLKRFKGRLGIKDAVDGSDVNYCEKLIKTYRAIAKDQNLIVFVDFLNMVNPLKDRERTETETQLAGFFKRMSTTYHCPVICTVETNKSIISVATDESTIKGSSSLQFRSDLTILLHSDFEMCDSYKMVYFDDQGKQNPIIRVKISKNKMGSFRGSMFYKFQRDMSKFEECSPMETEDFTKRFVDK